MRVVIFVLAAVLPVASLSCTSRQQQSASERTSEAATGFGPHFTDAKQTSLRRLESVTWNSVRHELTWDVSKGERKDNAYKPVGTDHYSINMDHATMTVNGETRRFSEDEATNVRNLMDLIARYAVESTVWWENGQGEPIDGSPFKPKNGKDPMQIVYRQTDLFESLERLASAPH